MIEIHNFQQGNRKLRASEAQASVRANSDWLMANRPDTLRRYKDHDKTTEAIDRMIGSRGIAGYTITVNAKPVGIATIIEKLRIRHPVRRLGSLAARQIDYWTKTGLSSAQHEEIVDQLCFEDGYEGRVLALLTEPETERALGIPLRMDKLGEPGTVRLPLTTSDRYGLTKVPQPIQTYIRTVEDS